LSAPAQRIRALLDAGVPDSVGHVLAEAGHDVIYHRDILPERTPDVTVAATALENDAVLVAIDHDMRQIAQKYGMAARGGRFDRLSLIRLCCEEVLSAKRLAHAMSFVEFEWDFRARKAARRMWVEIGPHHLRTNR